MKERIENILRVEGISPSRFADEVGVQRSGISHILSGRNNPSLDLLQKILNRYRNISADWLLTGRGSMFKGTNEEIKPSLFPNDNDNAIVTKQEESFTPTDYVESKKETEQIVKQTEKKITKIIVFYNDNSYEELSSGQIDL